MADLPRSLRFEDIVFEKDDCVSSGEPFASHRLLRID
jgi:hypothetical protein